MNYTYRLVWNRTLLMFVAVSECARTMGKSGGTKAIAGLALAAAILSGPAALAHTTSVGYEVLPNNSVEIWYGTYHNSNFTEGSLSFVGTNGYSATLAFNALVSAKPAGLADGITNFFSNGVSLVGTANRVIATWQGVTFSNLTAGTYTFNYIPLANPTQDWAPIDNVIRTGSFVITAAALSNPGVPTPVVAFPTIIDNTQPSYAASTLPVTGIMPFQGGTLNTDVDNATLAQAYTINNQGGTIDQSGHTSTFTGAITDATAGTPGALTIVNSGAGGSVTLAGANTYTGVTTINSGATLALGGTGTIAGSSGVVDNGMLDVSAAMGDAAISTLSGAGVVALGANNLVLNAANGSFAGTIAGTGGLTVATGSETLSGTNTYSGGTHILSGTTLALAGNGNLSNGTTVTADGTFDMSAANVGTTIVSLAGAGSVVLGANGLTLAGANDIFTGIVSGNGGLSVTQGAETLSGANTYTGVTTIANGATLALNNGGTLAASSGVLNDGLLDVSGAAAGVALKSLSGSGTVALGTNGLALTAAAGNFAGTINGSGGVAISGGSQTLSGSNTYIGVTEIAAGTTLSLAGAGSIAASNSVINHGTFDIGATTGGASVTTLSGNGTIALGAQQLTLSAAAGTFDGVVAGTGGIAVTGGKETLTGVNSYTGATQIASGATLALTNARGIAASSGVLNNGTLDISAANAGASLASLSGSGVITLGSNQLVLSNAAGTFSGNISGTGGLFVAAGTQTLAGINSYTGGTQINPGATLAIAGDGAITSSSSVLNNGTLTIASTLPAVMTSLAGNGTLNLAGQSVTFTQGADNFTGNITGTGTMSVTGGVQQLSGVNTIVGPVIATSGGTLKVASNASLGADTNGIILNNGTLNTTGTTTMARTVSITANGTIQTDSGTTLTSNGATSGTGVLVKKGAGILVLGGDNSSLTGGAIIDGGILKLASTTGIGRGAIALNTGTLETAANITLAQNIAVTAGTVINTDASTTTTLAGTVSSSAGGAGCFTKTGAGTLNVTGTGTYSMGVCVTQGMLRANGLTGASFVTVDAGATLRGSGAINGPVTVSGTLAPGNSPGTLTTSSNVTMAAGSIYQEDINGTGTANGPGNYSRLLISGAGQFNAGGATLAPNLVAITGADAYTAYVPKVGETFRIITAAGGLVGHFAPLVQPAGLAAGTRFGVFYNGDGTNSVDLRVLPTSYAGYSNNSGGNFNASLAGTALDSIMSADQAGTATAAQSRLAYAISSISGGSIAALTQNLGGQVHGAMAAIAPLAGQAVQGTVSRQLDQAAPGEAAARSALWADLAGNRAQWDSDSHASGFVANRGQLTVGVDGFRNDASRVGVGFSHARANLAADAGSGTLRENMAFVYGAHQGDLLGFDAMAGASRTNWETDRANPLGSGILTTGMDGRNVLTSVGVSAPWHIDGSTFKPFVRVLWQRTERDGGNEGTALAALSLGEYSASGTRATAGLSGNVKGGELGNTPYTMQYSFGIGRDNGTLARSTVDSSIVGIASTIVAPRASRSFVQAAMSGTVSHSTNTSSFYGVSTELHGNRADVSLSGGLRYAF